MSAAPRARSRRHRLQRPARWANLLAPTRDGGAVLLNVSTGTYLRLNATATGIAQLDREGASPEHAAMLVAARWSIPFETALADVRQVLTSIETLSAPRQRGRVPTPKGMIGGAREWWNLPGPLRRVTLEVAVVVVLVEVGLHKVDLARLCRWCGVQLFDGVEPRSPTAHLSATRHDELDSGLEWAIRWVLARWSFDSTCLRQALVFGFFVRDRHPMMRLGLLEDGRTAHAWLEVEGTEYNPLPVLSAFGAPTQSAIVRLHHPDGEA